MSLRNFFVDKGTSDEVYNLFILTMREMAADDALKGEDTAGYREAQLIIEKVWDKLSQEFEIDKPQKNINQAR